MAEKTFNNVRFQFKYDTYENWITNNPVLKTGEIAIATVPSNQDGVQNAPSVLIKVGDGTSDYKTLKFVSGLAADVHTWAKAEKKPTYEAAEITGIDSYIADYVNDQMGISVDTDTQYQIVKVDDYNYKLQSKGKTDSAWVDVNTIVIPKYDDTALAGRVTATETAIATLNGDASTVGSVAKAIGDAIAALDLANTYAAKVHKHTKSDITDFAHTHEIDEVTGLQDALDGKQAAGDYATKAEAQGYANAKDEAISAAQQAADDAQADVDALAEKVGTVPADKTVVQMIADAQQAATYDDTALAGRVTATEEAIGVLNGTGDGSVDKKVTDAINEFAAKVSDDGTVNTYKELIDYAAEHGSEFTELVGEVDANTKAIATLNGDSSTVGSVDKKIADAIAAENLSQYATDSELAATNAEVAKKANDADLAAIAKTGNVNDLVQTAGDVLIFNCGDSNF